jgi:NitT/TauT family transport system substrate-binding protein
MNRIVLAGVAALLAAAPAQAEKLRLALQKTGTTGWELAVVRAFGLDKEAGLDLEVTELGAPEAGKIALQGGSADIIVSDWLWVARERAQGARLTLYPYSTGVGAVMTKDPAIRGVKDLLGKKLGVAGGPLDKSWLMLKAFALKQGVDLEKGATILYGAPPLIAEKASQGEIDSNSGTSPSISRPGASRARSKSPMSKRRSAPKATWSSPAMFSATPSPRKTRTLWRVSSP